MDTLAYAWGETPSAADLERRLSDAPAQTVLLVHSETSTGVVADVESLARVARDAGALVVVDAVSSLGAVPRVRCLGDRRRRRRHAEGVDGAARAGLRDGLAGGLGAMRTASLPRFYFDWRRYRRALENLSTPFTPAVSTVAALDVALGLLLDEGLEEAFARHAALRPGVPRERSHGPRALLAGRGALGRRHRDPDARGGGRARAHPCTATAVRITVAGGHG